MNNDPAARYIDLLKRCLTRYGLEPEIQYFPYENAHSGIGGRARLVAQRVLQGRGLDIAVPRKVSLEDRALGRDWPLAAETMIGLARLDQLHAAIEDVISQKIPGDLIETGVWRGGAAIFMRAVLAAHGINDRVVWVADSFEGLPPADAEHFPVDRGDPHSTFGFLAVGLDEVRANFAKYNLLDEQVRFLKGWFRDTLPAAPIDQLAILRLDGDMYESTIQALDALYSRLSPGGYAIIDDYQLKGCRAAVNDFREREGIAEPIEAIDGSGIYWRKAT